MIESISSSSVFSDPAKYVDCLIKAAEKQKIFGLKKLIAVMEKGSGVLDTQLSKDIETIVAKEKQEGFGSDSVCNPFSGDVKTPIQKSGDVEVARAIKRDKKGPDLDNKILINFVLNWKKFQ